MDIMKIKLGLGRSASTEPIMNLSNERIRQMKELGVWKEATDAPAVFNTLVGNALDSIIENQHVLNVLRYNQGFKEVSIETEAASAFFKSLAGDMKRTSKSEASEGVERFFTEFKPLVKQFGVLLVFYTINYGYELVIRAFVADKYANVKNEYVNMVFHKSRHREPMTGIFQYSEAYVAKFTNDYVVLKDTELYLQRNLKKEERAWLNREKDARYMDLWELTHSNEHLEETGVILEAYNQYGDDLGVSERNRLLAWELDEVESKLDDLTDFDDIAEANFAIGFIQNSIDDIQYVASDNKGSDAVEGDIDLLKQHRGSILGVTGARDVDFKSGRSAFLDFLKTTDKQYSCLLNGGAYGFDLIATNLAISKGMDVIIASPTVTGINKLPEHIKLHAEVKNVKIGFLRPAIWKNKDVKDRFKERNDIIARFSDLVVYKGLKQKSGTISCLYACKRHKTPYKEL